jgi:MerR family transcriptional regulator, copper efflux regulator
MRITEAAQRLGTSPRMLRYRDMLGLLPPVRQTFPARPGPVHEAASARPGPVRETVSARPGPVRGAVPDRGGRAQGPPRGHRRFGDDDLAAVAHALRIEQRYDISPAALAFGLKVLTEPGVRAEVAELGRRIGRITPPPARALDFEQQRALRLLRLPGGTPRTRRN